MRTGTRLPEDHTNVYAQIYQRFHGGGSGFRKNTADSVAVTLKYTWSEMSHTAVPKASRCTRLLLIQERWMRFLRKIPLWSTDFCGHHFPWQLRQIICKKVNNFSVQKSNAWDAEKPTAPYRSGFSTTKFRSGWETPSWNWLGSGKMKGRCWRYCITSEFRVSYIFKFTRKRQKKTPSWQHEHLQSSGIYHFQ